MLTHGDETSRLLRNQGKGDLASHDSWALGPLASLLPCLPIHPALSDTGSGAGGQTWVTGLVWDQLGLGLNPALLVTTFGPATSLCLSALVSFWIF